MSGSSGAQSPPGDLALDTNRAIAYLNGNADAARQVAGAAQVYLPVPVVAELMYGAMNSANAGANVARVTQLRGACTVLEVRGSTADVYARVRLALKQKGKPIPENDIWIASICIENSVPLASDDHHFTAVDDLVLAAP